VSWTPSPSPGVEAYDVYRCGRAGELSSVPASQTSFTDTAAPPNHSYCYTVRSFDGAQESPDSGQVTTIYDTVLPTGSLTTPGAGAYFGTLGVASGDAADHGPNPDGVSGLMDVQFQASAAGQDQWTPIGDATSAPWSLVWDTTSVPDGSYDVRVVLTDRALNQTTSAVVSGIVLDNTIPQTGITSGPSGPTNQTSASIGFTTDTGTSFQCSLNGAGFSPCSSPQQYTSLPDGAYTFAVRALNAAGELDPSPATVSWTVDTVPPSVTELSGPGTYTNQDLPLITFGSDDPTASFLCQADVGEPYNGPQVPCSSPFAAGPFDDPGQPLHSVTVWAVDPAGNVSTPQTTTPFTVDLAPPTVTIDAPTPGASVRGTDVPITVTAVDNQTLAATDPVILEIRAAGSSDPWRRLSAPTMTPEGLFQLDWNTLTGAGAAADGGYDLQAVATDAASNQSTTLIRIEVANAAPTAPVLSGVATADATVQLTWTRPSAQNGIAGYRVVRDGKLVARLVGAATRSYVDVAVKQGHTYTYRVMTEDKAGLQSVASNAVRLTVADITPPSAPPSLHATQVGSSVELSWGASSDNLGVTAYRILRAGKHYAQVDGATLSFSDAAVTVGKTYNYRVVALDAAGNSSAASPLGQVTIVAKPGAPSGLLASLAAGPAVALSWGAAGGVVAGYVVLRDDSPLTSTSGTSYTDASVTQGATYTYTVEAANAAGVGAPSNAQTISVPDTTPPSAPSHVAAQAEGPNEVDLTWQASSDNLGVVAYDVYRNNVLIGSADGAATRYRDLTTRALVDYTYTLRARDAAGNASDPSNSAFVETPPAASGDFFSDGFESGDTSHWTSIQGFSVEQSNVYAGHYAGEAASTGAAAYGVFVMGSNQSDVFFRIAIYLKQQTVGKLTLMSVRDAAGHPIASVQRASNGQLILVDAALHRSFASGATLPLDSWHQLQIRITPSDGIDYRSDGWLDGVELAGFHQAQSFGATRINQLVIGQPTNLKRGFDLIIDKATRGTRYVTT
jgi:fibronectin type 3 domain-containing protein